MSGNVLFWGDPPPENASFQELVEYLRPKSRDEVLRWKPRPRTSQPTTSNKSSDPLLDSLGLTRDDFLRLAEDEPDLWEANELGLIQDRAVPPRLLPDLVQRWVEGRALKRRTRTTPSPAAPSTGVTIPAWFGTPTVQPEPPRTGPDPDDNWWEKRS